MEAFIPLAVFFRNQHIIKFSPLASLSNREQSAIDILLKIFCGCGTIPYPDKNLYFLSLGIVQYKQLTKLNFKRKETPYSMNERV
jgi:hypothetical protein